MCGFFKQAITLNLLRVEKAFLSRANTHDSSYEIGVVQTQIIIKPPASLLTLQHLGKSTKDKSIPAYRRTDLLKLPQVKGVLTDAMETNYRGVIHYAVGRFQKRIWEPYKFTYNFYTEIGLSQSNFRVKFGFKYIGFPFTFLGSPTIL